MIWDIMEAIDFVKSVDLPNAKDQPDHGIKYLRVGAVANTLCHGLGCIQLLGVFIRCWLRLNVEDKRFSFPVIDINLP